nr:hypothetical protein [uncultured Sphingomonas sp.]
MTKDLDIDWRPKAIAFDCYDTLLTIRGTLRSTTSRSDMGVVMGEGFN